MIGTFWNLCRACPSMPVDKLHSEYRSTYRWHEYTGPRQEVVRQPPQPVTGNKEEEENKFIENTKVPPISGLGAIEPALPRRKKNPSLAYRTNDFIPTKRDRDYYHTSSSLDRARCAGREGDQGSCRRSKSEGPPNQPPSPHHQRVLRSDSDPSAQQLMISNFSVENSNNKNGGLKNAISRISTEYRLQFAWPRSGKSKEDDKNNLPRKSLSMGAIKPQAQIAPVHKKRTLQQEGSGEMEPLVSAIDTVDTGEEKIQEESFSKEDKFKLSQKSEIKTEYEKNFRPFSQYDSNEIRPVKGKRDPFIQPQPQQQLPDTWFTEVIELRKKAGQYKHRGWGTELVPEHIAELYSKQMGLWEQVSRRSSLSALSLASSTHRPISKEEKEKENNKKSSPTKNWQHSKLGKGEKYDDYKKDGIHRSRFDNFVRHHLERTTGVGEQGILHSPTREKLEPVIPRKKDGSDLSQSPQKAHYTGRSQSAGSPKRGTSKLHQKTPPPEKRERPTTLQTAPTRTKSNTGSVKASDSKARGTHKPKEITSPNVNDTDKNKEEPDAAILSEPVVKSPPEPTRVKSPEQILMRSPEPVNWTVPLDTGKTFTVTQNVSQGDIQWRAQSESKARSESRVASLPPQSAPPQINDEKSEADKTIGELRCLEDPSFSFDGDTTGEDIMDKANTRFHHYWAANAQEPSQPSQ
ncbi:nuclear protein MDM1 isoform X3 [Cimex lectularius]|uniref:Nuclear protein MDM1 n=1 Tax=Cimex lectularius TaxID=79782 RepID=A0A8I6RZ48_CIMLE|nr:nuclear protein MDM1 isoform X3 [Cimex lectularius]